MIYTIIFIAILAAMAIVGIVAYVKGKEPTKQIKDRLNVIEAEAAEKTDKQ